MISTQTTGLANTTGEPSTADCVDLLRSLQHLNRARRRSTSNRADAGTLMMLSALDGCTGMRISALAEILMVDISAASRQVSALEAAGLIGRVRDDADHRAHLVTMTPQGQAALAEAAETAGSDIAHRISAWPDTDVRLLTDLVRKLADDLVASEPGCAKTHPGAARHFAIAT